MNGVRRCLRCAAHWVSSMVAQSTTVPRWRRVASTVLVVAYPLAIYVGLTQWTVRAVALTTLVVVGALLLLRIGEARGRQLKDAVGPMLPVLVLAAASGVIDDRRFLLVAPVLVSLALLWAFARSLRPGQTSMVERFARVHDPELPPGGVEYCRTVTKVWVCFFVVNAAIAGVLALWGPLSWWASYTGLGAYVLIGVVFTVEVVVRKARFRRYGRGPVDRVLATIFPPPTPPPS